MTVHRHHWVCTECGEAMPVHGNSGERSANAKLTADDVREIRWRAAHGETQTAIGLQFGVSQVSVHHILSGRSWSHVA